MLMLTGGWSYTPCATKLISGDGDLHAPPMPPSTGEGHKGPAKGREARAEPLRPSWERAAGRAAEKGQRGGAGVAREYSKCPLPSNILTVPSVGQSRQQTHS